MDVFIDRKKRVWIVDFNPFGDPSSSLLFEWTELQSLCTEIAVPQNYSSSETGNNLDLISIGNRRDKDLIEGTEKDFEFRIINHQRETFCSPSGASRGPIDVTLAPDFHKFMEICKNQDREYKIEENT